MTTAAMARALEAGAPASDPRLFRNCLGQFATGIAIITTQTGAARAAVTVNSFASVSLDPPLVLWSIAKTSRSYGAFTGDADFAVNVLEARQAGISAHFSSRQSDKFGGIDWAPGRHGAPLIAGCLAHLECAAHQVVDAGDHAIVIGHVLYAARFEGAPLLYAQGRYALAGALPETR